MDTKKTATIKLIETAGARPVLDVSMPPGTTFKAAAHVVARVDELILKLTSCPCNSGVDIHFRDGIVLPATPVNEHVGVG